MPSRIEVDGLTIPLRDPRLQRDAASAGNRAGCFPASSAPGSLSAYHEYEATFIAFVVRWKVQCNQDHWPSMTQILSLADSYRRVAGELPVAEILALNPSTTYDERIGDESRKPRRKRRRDVNKMKVYWRR